MSAEENKAALQRAVDAWNAGDLDGYLRLYDESVAHHGVTPEPLDSAANRGFYEGMWKGFPGARLTLEDVLAEGDKLAVRFHVSGRHEGDFMGLPPTNREFVLSGLTVMRFRDARIVERWTIADMFGLLTQLGALPAPA